MAVCLPSPAAAHKNQEKDFPKESRSQPQSPGLAAGMRHLPLNLSVPQWERSLIVRIQEQMTRLTRFNGQHHAAQEAFCSH